jgi:hypothetical protein
MGIKGVCKISQYLDGGDKGSLWDIIVTEVGDKEYIGYLSTLMLETRGVCGIS